MSIYSLITFSILFILFTCGMYEIGRLTLGFGLEAKELIVSIISVAIGVAATTILNNYLPYYWIVQIWVFLAISTGMVVGYLKRRE